MKPSRIWALTAFAIVILGAVLRVLAARGDLWLDEISTLTLVSRMHNPFQVFLLAHDNNHFLSSFYLYFIGPDAAPLAQRAFSIVLGVATIIAVGVTLAPAGRGAALLAMLLFAISFPMVNYGSEARGYAGLILCTVLAIHYLGKELREGRQRWKLAVTIFFGLLFHLTMVGTVFALSLCALAHHLQEKKLLKLAIVETVSLFLPTMLLVTLIAIDLVAAVHFTHKIGYGSVTLFDPRDFMTGYGSLIMAMVGLPGKAVAPFGIVIAVTLSLLCFWLRQPNDKRPGIYISFLIILPLAIFLCHVPNSAISRYYLTSGVAFLLCCADLASLAWKKGGVARLLVALSLLAFIVQTAQSLRLFLTYGRDHYSQVVAAMTSQGPASYTGTSNDNINISEIEFYAKRQAVSITYVPDADFCHAPPMWLIAATEPLGPLPPNPLQWGPESCRVVFARTQLFRAWGMSGLTVTLYHQIN